MNTDLMTAIQEADSLEITAERTFRALAETLNVDLLMPHGLSYRHVSNQYAKWSKKGETTPVWLAAGREHAVAFADAYGFEAEKREAAITYALYRIWLRKLKERRIRDPEIRDAAYRAEQARSARIELHKAVARVAKDKPENSFEAGLRVNVDTVLEDACENHLRHLLTEYGSPFAALEKDDVA